MRMGPISRPYVSLADPGGVVPAELPQLLAAERHEWPCQLRREPGLRDITLIEMVLKAARR